MLLSSMRTSLGRDREKANIAAGSPHKYLQGNKAPWGRMTLLPAGHNNRGLSRTYQHCCTQALCATFRAKSEGRTKKCYFFSWRTNTEITRVLAKLWSCHQNETHNHTGTSHLAYTCQNNQWKVAAHTAILALIICMRVNQFISSSLFL